MKPSLLPTDGSFYSERLLLLLHHFYSHSHQTEFELRSLILPWRFPRSAATASWEAFRTFWCLIHLKEVGVSIKSIHLNPAYFTISHNPEFHTETTLDPESVITMLTTPATEGLNPDGGGVFHVVDISQNDHKLLVAPSFFRLQLKINAKAIKGWLNAYLASYRKGSLSHHQPNFGLSFTSRLSRKILNTLKYRQGNRLTLNLNQEGKEEVLHVFRAKFNHEFSLWESGQYDLFFWHYLLHLSFKKLLLFEELNFTCPGLAEGHHESLYEGNLKLKLLANKSRSYNPLVKRLKIIEIDPTENKQFLLYLNEEYTKPILFSKSVKSGELLYVLAKDGYAAFKPYARAFEYISSDKRFKLFSQSRYSFAKVLERDEDGYIIPAEGIIIQLKTK